jgi:hypothetical protein
MALISDYEAAKVPSQAKRRAIFNDARAPGLGPYHRKR